MYSANILSALAALAFLLVAQAKAQDLEPGETFTAGLLGDLRRFHRAGSARL